MTDTDLWYGPDSATFGDRLAAARHKTGLSQKDLSKRLGVKLGTLRGWEEDISEPRANKLQMVAGLLNVSIMWLLNGEGDGLGDPDEEENVSADVKGILTEMRDVRTQMSTLNERLAKLEKRLRKTLEDTGA
jgi:transcriptional regulator with XRE-family HTH domain